MRLSPRRRITGVPIRQSVQTLGQPHWTSSPSRPGATLEVGPHAFRKHDNQAIAGSGAWTLRALHCLVSSFSIRRLYIGMRRDTSRLNEQAQNRIKVAQNQIFVRESTIPYFLVV